MKAIFLTNVKGNVEYVYGQENIDKIASLIDIDKNVYCEDDVLADPEKFKDVEYIFSTWGMPGGGDISLTDYLPNAKALFYAAGSVKYFAPEYFEKNVRITSAYAANAVPVAEYTVGQILLANKGFYQASLLAKSKEHDKASKVSKAHCGNYDARIGIVGAGMIGRRVIELLKPYRLEIMICDEFLSDEQAKALGGKKCDLKTLFEKCDVISNHLANVPATVGIFKKEHFESMKKNSTFINTGRGAQVDEDGMLKVLKERKDICAVLDVTVEEPPKDDSAFYTLENVFLTPHIAGSQANEVRRMAEIVVSEFERYINGEKMIYEITKEKLATMA
ncbi:MAG: hydroxyacid dehydrogenase [Clostridia bacterium]|nr:hydroxyacid dehydrogenase [Clostridia bacterium]